MWGYLEYHGGIQYCGGHHEYRGGCLVPWGEKSIVICVPQGTEHPHGTHDISHMHHDIPHGTQISKDGIPPQY